MSGCSHGTQQPYRRKQRTTVARCLLCWMGKGEWCKPADMSVWGIRTLCKVLRVCMTTSFHTCGNNDTCAWDYKSLCLVMDALQRMHAVSSHIQILRHSVGACDSAVKHTVHASELLHAAS